MNHVVMFSGGAASWMAAKRVAERHGTDNLYLIFADTMIEDEDLYRFLGEAAVDVGGHLVKLQEGRTPWEVFADVKFLGNSRIDPCSRVLKRETIRKYLESTFSPADTVIYLGMDWTEGHRMKRAAPHWEPWQIEAPLQEKPLLMKEEIVCALNDAGIEIPRLYKMGMPHNNCGGMCVKAGQGQFLMLLRHIPERYRWHEEQEERLRQQLGKDVAILRDRRGGSTRPLSLREFRERVEQQGTFDIDETEIGGCGCFTG